ncbi:hypothetical protein [Lewinella sp. W8]|uniref:HYC_CC_PP family protein n=1 Tax=Lewinella sp. W8 TaxID=2528208 RepID=UPI001067599A|nr:hypothetical protein [Lewinella sp. W8]MTB50021.1 hypothetical protein [Lewinella sp. W8]
MAIRFFNILLASLVFFGSVGIPVNRHFCRGELKSFAVFSQAEKCHQNQQRKHCPLHPPAADEKPSDEKKGCCDDEHEFWQTEAQETISAADFPAITPPLADLLPNISLPYRALPLHGKTPNFEVYRPPPLARDHRVDFQVFRL